ncbi:MAG: hypothetical protein LC112_16050 [Flavobacteriales bacterium]|nr:hypothetical protein [Flavobacteriales bacterium]
MAEVQNTGSSKVKLKAWFQNNSTGKIEFKSSVWLKDGDHLGEKTNNSSHNNYKIDRIFKSLKTGK